MLLREGDVHVERLGILVENLNLTPKEDQYGWCG